MWPKLLVGAAISILVAMLSLSAYSLYIVEQNLKAQKKSKLSFEHKTYPVQAIVSTDYQPLSQELISGSKLLVHLSIRCPHCLEVVKCLDSAPENTLMVDKIIPVFKAQPTQLDSFAKANNIKNLSLFHVRKNSLSVQIRSVPAFLLLDENNSIEKVSFGLPFFKSQDSTLAYVKKLSKNATLAHSGETENCQQ